jgi:hypothetical protein
MTHAQKISLATTFGAINNCGRLYWLRKSDRQKFLIALYISLRGKPF